KTYACVIALTLMQGMILNGASIAALSGRMPSSAISRRFAIGFGEVRSTHAMSTPEKFGPTIARGCVKIPSQSSASRRRRNAYITWDYPRSSVCDQLCSQRPRGFVYGDICLYRQHHLYLNAILHHRGLQPA